MNVLEREVNDFRVPNIKEVYRNLQSSLDEESFKQYKNLLRLYFRFKITKLRFDEEARKLLRKVPEQLHLHNLCMHTLLQTTHSYGNRSDAYGYNLSPLSPSISNVDLNTNIRIASQELLLPNGDLIRNRICVAALEHGLEDAENLVTDIVIKAIQIFLKNIITAMLSRVSGYKIRENNFQHAIGVPVPNPWLRNTSNIIDVTQESNMMVHEEKQTLEIAEQQTAFALSCAVANRNHVPAAANRITLRCLYDTLLYNPHVINNHSIYSINLERILAHLDCS